MSAADPDTHSAGGDPSVDSRRALLAVAVGAGLVALLLRLLFAARLETFADESVQGLLALRLLDGELPGPIWPGQSYGGTLEVPLQALLQALDRGNTFLLRLPLALAASAAVALFCVVVWRVSASLVATAAAGAVAAVAPAAFVSLGGWMTSGYNLSLPLALGAVVVLTGAHPRTRRRTAAACALLALATYEQPVSLLLAVPLLVLVSRSGYRITRREGLALAVPSLVLLNVFMAYDVVGSDHGLIFARLDSIAYPLSLRIRYVLGLELDDVPFDVLGPMPWLVAGLGGYPSVVATIVSVLIWTALVLVVALGRRWTPAWMVLVRTAEACVVAGLLALGVAVIIHPIGRLAYAACLLLALVVGALFTTPVVRAHATVAGLVLAVALGAHTVRLLADLPARGADAERTAVADELLERGLPVIGGYFDVYPLAFLFGDRLAVFPTFANRFPDAVYRLDPDATVVGAWVASAPRGATRAAVLALAPDGCTLARVERVSPPWWLGDMSCPRSVLFDATPRSN